MDLLMQLNEWRRLWDMNYYKPYFEIPTVHPADLSREDPFPTVYHFGHHPPTSTTFVQHNSHSGPGDYDPSLQPDDPDCIVYQYTRSPITSNT